MSKPKFAHNVLQTAQPQAYTFETIDDLLDRYSMLRDHGNRPAVCIAHGDHLDVLPGRGPQLRGAADRPVRGARRCYHLHERPGVRRGLRRPGLRPRWAARRSRVGASVEELSDRAWALKLELGNPLDVLMAAETAPAATC